MSSSSSTKNKKTALYLSFYLALTHAFTPISYRTQTSFISTITTNHHHHHHHHHRIHTSSLTTTTSSSSSIILKMSSVGGNDDNSGGGGSNSGGGSSANNNLDDWLDPRKASSESDNLKRAREKISEESLPINFDFEQEEEDLEGEESELDDDDDDEDDDDVEEEEDSEKDSNMEDEYIVNSNDENNKEEDDETNDIQSTMKNLIEEKEELTGKLDLLRGGNNNNNNNNNNNKTSTTAELMSSNPYLKVVSKLSPSDLISKFTSTAHPRVQDAVRSTVLGLIGTLPKMAFETTTITTGERLASLMFQLQLTGYMLKNADYRLSLSQSLGTMATTTTTVGGGNVQNQYLLEGDLDYDEDDEEGSVSEGKVRGKIKITYGKKRSSSSSSSSSDSSDKQEDDEDYDNDGDKTNDDSEDEDDSLPSMEVEVDAAAYMAELRNEVAKLREDLVTTRKEKEDEIRKDLLLYIRTLPQKELKSLTGTLSDDVLNAMKGLVNVVMAGIGEGQIGPDTVTEQSGEAMAQLCMWQLVVGYNLRELEVREEMKNALRSGSLDFSSESHTDGSEEDKNGEGSIDFDKGGFE